MLDLKGLKELQEKLPTKGWVSEPSRDKTFYEVAPKGDGEYPDWKRELIATCGYLDKEVSDWALAVHKSLPGLIEWIEKATPILQAIEPLAQAYCHFYCHDKNCDHCDYIQKDIPEAKELLKEVNHV